MQNPILRGRRPGLAALACATLAACALLADRPARAQWPPVTANLPVCTAAGTQIYRAAIGDGEGGMFVAWSDGRYIVTDIYIQHVRADGTLAWRTNGYPICIAPGRQEQAVLAADGAGGVFLAWRDFRGDPGGDVYAQHVGPGGLPTWTYNGVPVCTASDQQDLPVIAPARGPGGVVGLILAWEDYRFGAQVYAQYLDTLGVAQWADGGIPVTASLVAQYEPAIASDSVGGAFFAWTQQTADGGDVWAQHLGADGSALWSAAGVPLCTAAGDQYRPLAAGDGRGGVWFGWEDARTAPIRVYAQHAAYAGELTFVSGGVAACDGGGDQINSSIASDALGGLVLAWQDERAFNDVYAQRFDSTGVRAWGGAGLAVCTGQGGHAFPSITGDGTGGAIVGWEDTRGGSSDVYAQRITPDAQQLWTVNGLGICTLGGNQYQVTVVSSWDSAGVLVWSDGRNGNVDLYAQRVPLGGGSAPLLAAARRLSVAPNPAREATALAFELSAPGSAEIAIFDAAGRRVRTLAHVANDVGDHRVAWDARDDGGRRCAEGVYFARLLQGGRTLATRTIALAR